MEFQAVYLKFNSPVHFGDTTEGTLGNRLQWSADSIMGAIIYALAELLPEVDFQQLLRDFVQNCPPWTISSTYPYYINQGIKEVYLPRPLFLLQHPEFRLTIDPILAKIIKKTPYIPLTLFETWINQSQISSHDFKAILQHANRSLFTHIYSQHIPKISIDRITSHTDYFHYGLTYFSDQAGLYFLIKYSPTLQNPKYYQKLLVSALKYLQDTGLGGKRTWGLGSFEFTLESLSLKTPPHPDAYLTLSPVLPSPSDLVKIQEDHFASWNLKEKARWTNYHQGTRPLQLLPNYFFEEGSVFSHPIQGQFIDYNQLDSSLAIPFCLYGLGFSIPVLHEYYSSS